MVRLLHILIPFAIVSPIIVLLAFGDYRLSVFESAMSSWQHVLSLSLLQAALSGLVASLLGFIFAFGLFHLPTRSLRHRLACACYLLPALLPPISVATAVIRFADLVGAHFTGLWAIVLTHGLMNAGLVAVALDSYFKSYLGGLTATAQVLGTKTWLLIRRVLVPLLTPKLFSLFLLVFGFCLMSFVTPLLLAPGETWSVEVLIYQAFRQSSRLDLALWMSLLQMALVAWLVLAVFPQIQSVSSQISHSQKTLGHIVFAVTPIVFSIALVTLPLIEVVEIRSLMSESEGMFFSDWIRALQKTLIIVTLSVLVSFLLLIAVLYAFPRQRLHKFLNSAVGFSPVLLGFSFWLLGANFSPVSELKIASAISLFFLPVFYRWLIGDHLQNLQGQRQVARAMGASDWQVFWGIVWPQSKTLILICLSLICLWSAGDFVMTSLVSFSSSSLPQLVETLSTGYRLGLAQLTSLSILVVGGLSAGTVWGLFVLFEKLSWGERV
jgi:thiamine transport system permease protein